MYVKGWDIYSIYFNVYQLLKNVFLTDSVHNSYLSAQKHISELKKKDL